MEHSYSGRGLMAALQRLAHVTLPICITSEIAETRERGSAERMTWTGVLCKKSRKETAKITIRAKERHEATSCVARRRHSPTPRRLVSIWNFTNQPHSSNNYRVSLTTPVDFKILRLMRRSDSLRPGERCVSHRLPSRANFKNGYYALPFT